MPAKDDEENNASEAQTADRGTSLWTTPPVSPGTRRKTFRLTLRTLMVVVLVIGGGVGWKANRARTQRRAVEAVKAAGGFVSYDFQYPNDGKPKPKEPLAPKWLRNAFGDEYFQEVASVGFKNPVAAEDLAVIESFDHLKSFFIGDSSRIGDGLAHLRRVHIEHVQLTGPGITDAGLTHLAQVRGLKLILLQRTAVTDNGLRSWAELPDLESLTIFNASGVTDEGLVPLGKLTSLRSLYLSQAPKVTDLAFEHLREKLLEIEFLGLDLTGITDAGLSHLKEMPRLKGLRIAGTNVTDAGLVNLAEVKELRSLTLHGTGLTDEGMETIRSLKNLRSLSVGRTKVTDAGLARLDDPGRFVQLFLPYNPSITDASTDQLARFTGLTELFLTGTELTDVGLARLAGLTALKRLDVQDTKVTAGGIAALKAARPTLRVTGGPLVPRSPAPNP